MLDTTKDSEDLPEPPTYKDTSEASISTHLPTAELLNLAIDGDKVVLQNSPHTTLYELSQAPLSRKGKVLAIQQVFYKPTKPFVAEPGVSSRLRHLYDFKAPNYLPPSFLGVTLYLVEPQLGRTHCFAGAALIKGKATIFGTIGKSWHVISYVKVDENFVPGEIFCGKRKFLDDGLIIQWVDGEGSLIAIEKRPILKDVSEETRQRPSLELKKQFDDKLLHLLVLAWCSALWNDVKDANTPPLTWKECKFIVCYCSC
jgi:hypothetical protein